jgi:hypothetical protein
MEGQTVIFTSEECVVCLEEVPGVLFTPCRHRCTCAACADLIQKAAQACPLCRAIIAEAIVYKDQEAAGDVIEPVPTADLEAFSVRREEYVKRLRAPVTSDACFRGKGKLARSVATEVMSELEQRQRETAGTERVMAKPDTIQFEVLGDNREIQVQYKLGRSKRQEAYPYMTLQEAHDGLLEYLGGDRIDVLGVATHYPEYYWAIRMHTQSVENYLDKQMGVLQKGRRK